MKVKKCKGINKAKGFEGCGIETPFRTYGLCPECFKTWLYTTDNGKLEVAKKANFAIKTRVQEERKRIKKKKEELMTVQDWIKIAQQAFNAYIRERDKDQPCISCGKPLRKGNTDAGHLWSSGGHKFITLHEDNVNAQCSRPCNKDKGGDFGNYEENLKKRIGEKRVQWLRDNRNNTVKFTRQELKGITEHYRAKLKELKNQNKDE